MYNGSSPRITRFLVPKNVMALNYTIKSNILGPKVSPHLNLHCNQSSVIKKIFSFSDTSEIIETKNKNCPICNRIVDDIEEHVKANHPKIEGVVCPHCCKLLSKKCTLNRHIEQVHLGLQIFKPAKCTECGKVFSKKGHLDRHVRTIHMGLKDESEPCPHCGKIFTTKSSLEPHIEAVHKGIRR